MKTQLNPRRGPAPVKRAVQKAAAKKAPAKRPAVSGAAKKPAARRVPSKRIEKLQAEVVELTGIDPKHVGPKDAHTILRAIHEGKLAKDHKEYLLQVMPGFIDAVRGHTEMQVETVKAAGKSQVEALQAMNNLAASINCICDALKELACRAESERLRKQVAGQLGELAKIALQMHEGVQKLNKDNNGFWRKMSIALGLAAVVLVQVLAAAALENRRRDQMS